MIVICREVRYHYLEILKREQYREYEEFVSNHPRGVFTQSIFWGEIKNNWQFEAVVSRDDSGKIQGACGVLVQKIPLIGTSFLYSPRGPVCDIYDTNVMDDLKKGVDHLAKVYNAHLYKVDTDVLHTDDVFIQQMEAQGYKRHYGPIGFETIQARFNHRLSLVGKTQEEVLMGFTQKTRYNVRYAIKHGVVVKVKGSEALDEFMTLYRMTGQRDGFNIRPKDYFQRFLDSLGDHVRLYIGYCGDTPVCGAITTNYGGKCSYIYGASDNEHRKSMANYLMQWEMIQWAIDTHCYVYDFQGIAGDIENQKNPMYGLYRFKRGFGGEIDELAGEFNYIYRPIINAVFSMVMAVREKLRRTHH